MSRAAIAAAARSVVENVCLEAHAHVDVLRTLEETANDTPPFLLAVGLEAGIARAVALARAVGVAFHIAALQLADDIADGDCHYITPAEGAGAIAQFMLQNLGFASLLDGGLSSDVLRGTARDMALGASAQSLEVRTKSWTLKQSRLTADGFGAVHYAAYFRLMLHGSEFEGQAVALGRAVGIAAAVSSDLVSKDPRVMTLSVSERVALIQWALRAASAASETQLRSVSSAVQRIEMKLVGELARLAEHDFGRRSVR